MKVAGDAGVRYREARYMPDGKSIVALSTADGRDGVLEVPGQRRRQSRAVDPRREGAALGRRASPRTATGWPTGTRTRSSGSTTSSLPKDKRIAQSMNGDFWGPRLVARQPVARLRRDREQRLRPVQDPQCQHRARSMRSRPTATTACGLVLEQGRQVALLPFRPNAEDHRRVRRGEHASPTRASIDR